MLTIDVTSGRTELSTFLHLSSNASWLKPILIRAVRITPETAATRKTEDVVEDIEYVMMKPIHQQDARKSCCAAFNSTCDYTCDMTYMNLCKSEYKTFNNTETALLVNAP